MDMTMLGATQLMEVGTTAAQRNVGSMERSMIGVLLGPATIGNTASEQTCLKLE